MNRIDLSDQVAIVTGGAQGIGFAVALRLVESGAKVAILDHNEELVDRSVISIGTNTVGKYGDVRNLSRMEKIHHEIETELGPISLLVNSAGIAGRNVSLQEYDPEEWRNIIDVNLIGTFNINRVVIPGMIARNYGRIVNISSIAGKEGNPNASAYSASKAGVIALTKSIGK